MKLLLIEGIPESGKTTMAEYLCSIFNNSGMESEWYLEESKEHPIHPKSVTKFSGSQNFPDICLNSWEEFVNIEESSNVIHIMEGSAFQTTVRFMMEYEIHGITNYFEKFAKIVEPLSPVFIYLRPNNVIEASRLISKKRGNEWAKKVSN